MTNCTSKQSKMAGHCRKPSKAIHYWMGEVVKLLNLSVTWVIPIIKASQAGTLLRFLMAESGSVFQMECLNSQGAIHLLSGFLWLIMEILYLEQYPPLKLPVKMTLTTYFCIQS